MEPKECGHPGVCLFAYNNYFYMPDSFISGVTPDILNYCKDRQLYITLCLLIFLICKSYGKIEKCCGDILTNQKLSLSEFD